jgi:hypothetical protein
MSTQDLVKLIREIAMREGVDPELCLAIAGKETELVNSKTRFERDWSYLVFPEKYARALGITIETETMLQKTSFTAMQIMASCCREIGFKGYLTDLNFPEIGLFFAIKKLKAVIKRFGIETDVISSWNQGYPKKTNNVYLNQEYVDDVSIRLKKLRNM